MHAAAWRSPRDCDLDQVCAMVEEKPSLSALARSLIGCGPRMIRPISCSSRCRRGLLLPMRSANGPPAPSVADLIRYLLDQHGLTRADMVPILGRRATEEYAVDVKCRRFRA